MANSDYTVGAQGALCTYAVLAENIDPGTLTFNIDALQEISTGSDLEVGMPILIGDEIMRLDSFSLPSITVARGCADTIPAAHLANSGIWFFSAAPVSDEVTYLATETIAVKSLPFSVQDGAVPVANAPPMDLTFNWRFFRPYPPGNVELQGSPFWSQVFEFEDLDTEFVLTWAHRDRIGQADQLIDHTEPDIGPEAGTTYTVRVYDKDDNLVRTVMDIAGTTWNYPRVDAEADVPNGTGRITLHSVRDSIESLYGYTIRIKPNAGGFGEAFGENFGG